MDEDIAALVGRARKGEREAFAELVRRHLRAMYAVALAHLGRPADAEDAAQDACVRALAHIDECREPERFGAWILQIARNRARTMRERRRSRDVPRDEGAEQARGAPTGEQGHTKAATRAELLAALDTLGQVEREAVLLCDLEGCSHREIAESLGITEAMSRQHVSIARRKLRERLGE